MSLLNSSFLLISRFQLPMNSDIFSQHFSVKVRTCLYYYWLILVLSSSYQSYLSISYFSETNLQKSLSRSNLQFFFYNLDMLLIKAIRQGAHSIKIPNVDISNFLTKSGDWKSDCKKIAQNFRKYGLVIIKDPRVNAAQNETFLDLNQRYFNKRSQQFYQGNKTIDVSPETNFRTGLLPQFFQKFQSYEEEKLKLKQPYKALSPLRPSRDPKWRFLWKLDDTHNLIPSDFPQWESTMNKWGGNMKNGCLSIAQMLAIGLDIQPQFFTSRLIHGDFMLSPTAVDLARYKQGEVLAAFHRDFDLFTTHGKAKFPGLFSWLNTGEKLMIQVPEGHLLIQAGKMLQWITGGYITAGFHEVIYSKEVQEAKERAKEKGKVLWRVSSTMFCQMQGRLTMKPHQKFANTESNRLYPQISATDYLMQQLYSLIQEK